MGVASPTPGTCFNNCGCFLPDLTRLATLQCGEARHMHFNPTCLATSVLFQLHVIFLMILVYGYYIGPRKRANTAVAAASINIVHRVYSKP